MLKKPRPTTAQTAMPPGGIAASGGGIRKAAGHAGSDDAPWREVLAWSLYVPTEAEAVEFVEGQRLQDGALSWRVLRAHGRLTRGRFCTAQWWVGQVFFPYDAETGLKEYRLHGRRHIWRFDTHGVIRWHPVTVSMLRQWRHDYERLYLVASPEDASRAARTAESGDKRSPDGGINQ